MTRTKRSASATKRLYVHKPETILKLSRQDVENIERQARYVFVVDAEGVPLVSWKNEAGELEVIAVLGPGVVNGVDLGTAVLLEIGFHRARPYRDARGKSRQWIQRRRNYTTLSAEQLKNIWPHLEEVMVGLMYHGVRVWKSSHTSFFQAHHIASKRKGLRYQRKERRIRKGVRFSVAFKDRLVLASVLQSEVNRRQISIMVDTDGARNMLFSLLNQYLDDVFTQKRLQQLARAEKSRINSAVTFLANRNFLPHQLSLILEKSSPQLRERIEALLTHFAIADVPTSESWGALLGEDVPVFSDVYTWCLPIRRNKEGERKVYDQKKRRWVARGSKHQDFLVFELACNL